MMRSPPRGGLLGGQLQGLADEFDGAEAGGGVDRVHVERHAVQEHIGAYRAFGQEKGRLRNSI